MKSLFCLVATCNGAENVPELTREEKKRCAFGVTATVFSAGIGLNITTKAPRHQGKDIVLRCRLLATDDFSITSAKTLVRHYRNRMRSSLTRIVEILWKY